MRRRRLGACRGTWVVEEVGADMQAGLSIKCPRQQGLFIVPVLVRAQVLDLIDVRQDLAQVQDLPQAVAEAPCWAWIAAR